MEEVSLQLVKSVVLPNRDPYQRGSSAICKSGAECGAISRTRPRLEELKPLRNLRGVGKAQKEECQKLRWPWKVAPTDDEKKSGLYWLASFPSEESHGYGVLSLDSPIIRVPRRETSK